MFSMQRCFKTNQKLVRGTSNLLVERIESIMVFKIDVFFVSLKEEIPKKSVSGTLLLKTNKANMIKVRSIERNVLAIGSTSNILMEILI